MDDILEGDDFSVPQLWGSLCLVHSTWFRQHFLFGKMINECIVIIMSQTSSVLLFAEVYFITCTSVFFNCLQKFNLYFNLSIFCAGIHTFTEVQNVNTFPTFGYYKMLMLMLMILILGSGLSATVVRIFIWATARTNCPADPSLFPVGQQNSCSLAWTFQCLG